MLNHLFKPPVSRGQHEAELLRQRDQIIAMMASSADERVKAIETERDKAIAERDAVFDEHTLSVNRELKATALLHRSLILLKEVDPSRTGGKQLREARERLFADAMLAGLWEEVK